MPVSVSLPIRLRIDRTALERHPEWIQDAAEAAVGRAMRSSAKAVLAPRGGFMGVTVHEPTFGWHGLPVHEHARAGVEGMLTESIQRLAEEHGVRAPILGPDVPELMPADATEFYDDTKGSRFLGRYTVDSYEGGQVDVPVEGKKPPSLLEDVELIKIITDIHDAALDKIFELAEKATVNNPLGVIFRYDMGGKAAWQVIIVDGKFDDNGVPQASGLFQFDEFMALHFQGEKADPMFVNRPYIPSPGRGTAQIIEVPSDASGRKTMYKDLFGDLLGQAFRRQSPKKVSMTTPKYNELIDESVLRGVDEAVQRIGGARKAVKVTLGQASMVLWMAPDQEAFLKWTKVAHLTALTVHEIRFKQDKKRGGEPGGTGTETTLRYRSDGGGSIDCPRDEIDKEKWGELEGEPAIDELGDAGVVFKQRMSYIAKELGMPEGKYAGQFCVDAGKKLIELAIATQDWDETSYGENRPTDANGNMGSLDFKPGGSPIIAAIRRYAGIVKSLSEFMLTIEGVFMQKDYGCAVHGVYRGNGVGWILHFFEEVVPVMREAVYHLFISGCRSTLIQLLVTSQHEIEKRQKAMDRYAPIFEKWIVPQIIGIGELSKLRSALLFHEAQKYTQPGLVATGFDAVTANKGDEWARAAAELVTGLSGAAIQKSAGAAYDVVHVDGVDKIRDQKGNLWSKDELEQAIGLQSNVTMGIDPLFKQITDTEEAIERFKTTDSIRAELERLLQEMLRDNGEMQMKAGSDAMWAFGATSRSEDIPHATVEYSKYALHGIHKITHDQIGDAFRGTKLYAAGIDYLFDSEEGKASLKGFGLMVGMVALAVLVPGGGFLAFAVGVGTAAAELDAAKEKKRLYRALIDPDKVLSWAEVEVGLFVAWFGLVMSFVPEGASAVKGLAAKGTKALVTSGEKAVVKAEGQTLAKRAASRVAKELAEYAAKDLLQAFIVEAVMNIVISQLIEQVLTPVIDGIQVEAGLTTTAQPLGDDLQGAVDRAHDVVEESLGDENEMNVFLEMVLSQEGEP